MISGVAASISSPNSRHTAAGRNHTLLHHTLAQTSSSQSPITQSSSAHSFEDEPENESEVQVISFSDRRQSGTQQYIRLPMMVTAVPSPTPATSSQPASSHSWSSSQWRTLTITLAVIVEVVAVCGMFCASIAYDIAKNHGQGSFWAYVPVHIAVALFFISLKKQRESRAWNIAGFTFVSIAVFLVLVGAIVDGVHAAHLQGTDFSRCNHASEAITVCRPQWQIYWLPETTSQDDQCSLDVEPLTCYCCYLYHELRCNNRFYSSKPYVYKDVKSCDVVDNYYRILLWCTTGCCSVTFILLLTLSSSISQYNHKLSRVDPEHPSWTTYPGSVIGHHHAFVTDASAHIQGANFQPAPSYESVMREQPPVYRSQWLHDKPPDYTP